MRRLVAAALTIISSAISSEVLAQSRFIDVGAKNETVLLDRNSIKGTQFNLVSQETDGSYTIQVVHLNCERKIFVLAKTSMYDRNNRLFFNADEPSDVSSFSPNSTIGRSAAIVCNNR